MYLLQILLPLTTNDGVPFSPAQYASVRSELTQRFGGLTVYSRSPAVGLWDYDASETKRDDIVIFEVMSEILDETWWRKYRERLEQSFHQRFIVIRAHSVQLM